MQKIFCMFLFLGAILSSCSIGVASPSPVPAPTTEVPIVVPTTPVPSNPEQCGYQWASQSLPELSSSVQKSLQELQPEALANASAFGENCVREDGSVVRFSAMETDFNVIVQVPDITDEADLGAWIVKVMQIIEKIPKEQIVGPQPGRVSLTFQAGSDQHLINFYINQYQKLPSNLSTAEVYRALQIPQ